MPVEVTKFTCAFKCGAKAVSKERQMNGHETICWKNPLNKTCKSCSNEIYVTDSDGFRSWINRGCKIDKLNEVLENLTEVLKGKNSIHIRPIHKCQYHNKQEDENAAAFAELLEKEISEARCSGSEHFPYYIESLISESEPDIF